MRGDPQRPQSGRQGNRRQVKLVVSGAGAAALACLDLLVKLGLPQEHITVTDIKGVVYKGRKEEMDPDKAQYAIETKARTLGEVIAGAAGLGEGLGDGHAQHRHGEHLQRGSGDQIGRRGPPGCPLPASR